MEGNEAVDSEPRDRDEAYGFVRDTLERFGYRHLGSATRGWCSRSSSPRPASHSSARVDFGHVGDRDGVKGLYLMNLVDPDRSRSAITQYEFVGAVVGISERFLVPLLKGLLLSFPFDRPPVDGYRLAAVTRGVQHVPAGREGVGGNHVSTRFEVGLVYATDRVWMRPIGQSAPRGRMHLATEPLDFRAGGAVEHDDVACGEFLVESYWDASARHAAEQVAMIRRVETEFRHTMGADRNQSIPSSSRFPMAR